MAIGIPVFVSPYVALAEEIAKAQAGRVIDLDPAAWAEAIEQLLADPVKTRAMGESGRRLAATEFSSDRIAVTMRDTYATILRGDRL